MRCATDKVIRVSLTFLMAVLLVYLGSHSTDNPAPHTQVLSLILPKGNDSPPQFPKPVSPRPTLKPYTVINNKVYYLDALPTQSSPASSSSPARKPNVVLEHSEAAALQNIDYSTYSPEERQYLESRVPVMVDRAAQVKRACVNAPAGNPRFPHLVFDQVHHVVWCPNYKVASTTWMINFLKMTDFNEDNPAIPADLPPEKRNELKYSPMYGAKHYEVYKLYPTPPSLEEKVKVAKDSARVIIVRHPFTRILSAYRDKMVKPRPLPAKFKFKDLQKSIIKKYRAATSTDKSPFPSFPEFVQHVIDHSATFTTGADWRKNVKCWVPYWAQCNVCTIDYNVIIKLETMTEDERFLIVLSNMEELKKSEGEWRHLRNVSSTEAAADFYRQLTTRQMLDLHQRYKLDFDLFGYSLDTYLPLAKDAPSSPRS